jgi:histone acetyltransferase (RNA polymerase elongator complex component)
MKKHANIPIFIPHYGCPNACVFCNQVRITGKPSFTATDVRREIDNALKTLGNDINEVEIAFFGGSFTAIPRDEMLALLTISDEYLKEINYTFSEYIYPVYKKKQTESEELK